MKRGTRRGTRPAIGHFREHSARHRRCWCAPALPYFEQPVLTIGPVHLYAFGAIVAVAVILGVELLDWRARKVGLDPFVARSFALWIVAPGFLAAHVLDALWYPPAEVVEAPASLLAFSGGFSSFGGFLGALGGAFAWRA